MSKYRDTVVATDGLYAYWTLNETSGATATDESGNGRDGTYHGSPTLGADPLTVAGNAVDFDGDDDYVDIGCEGFGDLMGGAFAIEFWAAWTSTSRSVVLGTVNDSGSEKSEFFAQVFVNGSYDDDTAPGHITIRMRDSEANGGNIIGLETGGDNYNDGEAHHVVIQWDGQLQIYVDSELDNGTLSDDGFGETSTADHPFTVAATNLRGSIERFFPGRLDHLSLYTRSLTPEEIYSRYLDGRYGTTFKVAGAVQADGEPAEITVRAYRWDNGAFVDETTSDPADGSYTIDGLLEPDALMVVTKPADGFRPLAHGPVTPVEV